MMNTRTFRGFSLIEVLVSVVVLSLGLLGLAAVFPAVIRQQRDVVESRTSDSARDSIREVFQRTSSSPGQTSLIDWSFLKLDDFISLDGPITPCGQDLGYSGEWETDWNWNGLDNGIAQGYSQWGEMVVGGGEHCQCLTDDVGQAREFEKIQNFLNPPNQAARFDREPTLLRSYSRLMPQPFSGVNPEYVWDFVPRKLPGGVLQVAVIVRRIDSGIGVPQGSDLSSVLVGDVSARRREVLPVAEDPATGRPSLNGRGVYSLIRQGTVVVDDGDPTQVIASGDEDAREFISQIGQRLIGDDFNGTVQEVVDRQVVGRDVVLTLKPGYSESEAGQSKTVLYTPQVAVHAFVENVR